MQLQPRRVLPYMDMYDISLFLFCSHASLAAAASSSGNAERVELAVLKPLWQLYTSMLKKYGTSCDLWVCHVYYHDLQMMIVNRGIP